MTYSVNVRTIAEFALEGGDLALDFRAMDRMLEGVRGHMELQAEKDSTWRSEEIVAREDDVGDIRLRVQGRADAVRRHAGALTIEEIKTTSRAVGMINDGEYPAHWAQAQIYAYIIAEKEGYGFCEVALVYYNLGGSRARFSRSYTLEKLRELYYSYIEPYARWLTALEVWKGRFAPSANALDFPFDTYREGQREMARNVFIALREKKRVMIEAPTGIGKTAAALFGAVKASGAGLCSSIFYLTARTTGRRAAENALELMREKGLRARAVTISAKEKACVPGDLNCFGCPYSNGYFDRHRAVLVAALDMERLGADEIGELARENTLCPFELSLDLAESADVIICDYNYVFDPRVRLSRFFARRSKCALLVDEAHNLPERARDMLSAEMSGKKLARLRRELGKDDPLRPAFADMLKYLRADEDAEPESRSIAPEDICLAAQRFSEALMGGIPDGHPRSRELAQLLFDAAWFYRVFGDFDENTHRALITPEGKYLDVKLMCYDPSRHIDASLKRVSGAAMFSATLTPGDFYARQLAVNRENGDAQLFLPSPFPSENQLTLIVPLPTRFREREHTLNAVTQALEIMCSAKKGNYIACFPSYAYLNLAYERFRMNYPEIRAVRQKSGMRDAERLEFIEELAEGDGVLAFVALGGVFAEGVDLPGDRLIGAAIISVGIPQLGGEREVLREMSEEGDGEGYDQAYVYPGFRRVAQAAGRVIRTETDRGVVLLIDERFRDEKYVSLMPSHWQIRVTEQPDDMSRALKWFWSGK